MLPNYLVAVTIIVTEDTADPHTPHGNCARRALLPSSASSRVWGGAGNHNTLWPSRTTSVLITRICKAAQDSAPRLIDKKNMPHHFPTLRLMYSRVLETNQESREEWLKPLDRTEQAPELGMVRCCSMAMLGRADFAIDRLKSNKHGSPWPSTTSHTGQTNSPKSNHDERLTTKAPACGITEREPKAYSYQAVTGCHSSKI